MLPLDIPLSACVVLFFDCPSNLKEAIDWILRVTGKDGGGGGGTTELTNEVKKLLEEVKASVPESNKKEFEQVRNALNTNSGTGGLITKLAEGLQQFIGYGDGNKAIIRHSNNGIGASTDPLERLQDAVLGFLIEVIKRLDGKTMLTATSDGSLQGIIGAFQKALNRSGKQFNEVVKSQLNLNHSSSGTTISNVVKKLIAVQQLKSKASVDKLAPAFKTYVDDVLEQVKITAVKAQDQVSTLKNSLDILLTQLKDQKTNTPFNFEKDQVDGQKPLKEKLDAVVIANKALNRQLSSLTGNQSAQALCTAVYSGTDEFLWQLQKGYKSYYQGTPVNTSNWNGNQAAEAKTCAQIFLGCIPLIYHCLTQFYWLCNETSRGWDKYPFSGGGLRNLMVALGYGDAFLGGSTGKTVMTNVASKFNELSSANDATSKPYPEFLNTLRTSFNNAFTSSPSLTDQTIPALYHIARLYFRHQHGRNADKTRPPSSIREMLYWLSGLQFSPQYDSLQNHISGVFRNLLGKATSAEDTQLSLPVADSGATNDSNNKLSAFDLKGYLTMTCLYSPMVLGRIQGPGTSRESTEPYLHYLFGNGMSFAYPSGAALLSKLSEYTYALQFQLSFLTQQCFTHNGDGCGWRHCRFGKDIEPRSSASPVTSHICHAGCTHGSAGSSNQCSHDGSKCGQSNGNQSPLQAFLTDNLQGFRRSHPGTSDHLVSCSSNSMCHVPMGFKAEYLRETPGYGYHVFYPLLFYCSDNTRPLRLLSDKLHCISNYTPRSLGDMLGFYLQMCLQVFNKRSETLPSYITKLLKPQHPSRAGLLIFEYLEGSIVELGSALHGVVRHCHNKPKGTDNAIKHQNVSGNSCSHSNSQSPADLWSLFALDNQSKYPNCATGGRCGAYLSPLTRSNGSTFGKSAAFASTYLSWVSYLADDFRERLEGLLNDFTNITCTDCRTQNGKNCNCSKGNHGTPNCQCDSVVSCSGVLPLFYEHGFNFLNVKSLSGKGSATGNTKRTCQQFHSQLQNVINGDPLYKLLITVDRFLYAIRWEFFSKLSGFWTIYICLILYTFFFLLDTLHLRSHIKLTSSHSFPPLTLLTSGKPLPITKLTYIGQ
ncbi:variant erythrocyte surface antigen-1 family protein [Babesia caballi]|uniref:Variant erythrocyte surface antigen-1 family protein n=1 Tax=Babesia caballi TaxID=5871 RepID=A0AAV4LXI6_BABCB|nr:variant erythrocyte surface antigen-1 family protein [Babesia caballi]